MNIEIERRFLVDRNKLKLPKSHKSIKQAYLLFDDNQVLRVRKTDNNFHSLMIISHNPGMEIFAREISKNKTDKHYESIDLKYPTGGLVIIRFNLNIWSKIKYET